MDFSSFQGTLLTMGGLALVTLIGVSIRLLVMMTVQQRRERMNRQINERLRTLIAAYKTLGGSFTGNLSVDPAHLRDLRHSGGGPAEDGLEELGALTELRGSDRSRRMRDAVEAALSDILLLGTDEHVRLAVRAAQELASGRSVHMHELVIALRAYVRQALQLTPIPEDLAAAIPRQGPTRPVTSGGSKGKSPGQGASQSTSERGGRSGGSGMAVGGMGIGAGMVVSDDSPERPS